MDKNIIANGYIDIYTKNIVFLYSQVRIKQEAYL